MQGQEEELGTPMDLTHRREWEDTPTSQLPEAPEWAVLLGKRMFPGGEVEDVLMRPPIAGWQEPQGGTVAEEGGVPPMSGGGGGTRSPSAPFPSWDEDGLREIIRMKRVGRGRGN